MGRRAKSRTAIIVTKLLASPRDLQSGTIGKARVPVTVLHAALSRHDATLSTQ